MHNVLFFLSLNENEIFSSNSVHQIKQVNLSILGKTPVEKIKFNLLQFIIWLD